MKKTLKSVLMLGLAGAMLVGCSGGTSEGGSASAPASNTTSSAPAAAATADTTPKGGVVEGKTAATEQIDKIVIAANSASTDASPYAMNTPIRGQVHEALYATLFYVEPLHFIDEVQSYVGKEITKVDDYTYDIEIFDNVTDSKGNPIKAQDVKWSYEYSFKNQEFLQYGTDVESFEVVDDTHLRMVVKKTVPGVIEKLMCTGAITIVNQEWFEGASDEERQMDPATTGPYNLVSNISGSEIVVEANDNYWQKDASQFNPIEKRTVKTIDWKVITEDSMRAIALENQEIDAGSIGAVNLHRFMDMETGEALPGYNVWVGTTSPLYHLIFCNMDPNGPSVLAHDVNLRKAALYALSAEDIMLASGNTFSTANVLRSFAVQGQGGYQDKWLSDEWDYFNYDPEKAQEFYAAAGKKPGEVEITVLTSISLYSDSVRSVIIANLEEAGFKVNSLAVDQALFLNYRFENDQWDLIMDVKGAGDYVVTGWDQLFNPVGYSNGSVCFTHDDKLVELLAASQTNTCDETINAFNDYIIEQAICKALYDMTGIQVCQDGVIEMAFGQGRFLPEGSTYASDWVSAPNANNN